MRELQARLTALPLWSGPITLQALPGGMTNRNLLIEAPEGRFVARLAVNNALHGIDRAAEQAATRAAASAGLGPEVVWVEPDLMILRHIDGSTLQTSDFINRNTLILAVELLSNTYRLLPHHYSGPRHDRRVMTTLTRYADTLSRQGRWSAAIGDLRPLLGLLESRLADIPLGFAHNDVHGANLVDDGARLWLIDWEYAGQGQPLADLASLANNALLSDENADIALMHWLSRKATVGDRTSFAAMRLATAMRDLFWGYAQDEAGSDTGLAAYIAINQDRVKAAAARL